MKKNIAIFFSIFVFAVLLWFYISLNLFYTVTLTVPLDVNVAKSQALASKIPSSIYVTIKGKGWDLVSLLVSENLTYYLDLTDVKKDIKINTFNAVTERLNVPHNVEILNTYPNSINISFDMVQKKRVRVKNNIRITPKEEYIIIGNPEINPDSVNITGAKSILSKIKYIPTETKKLENINESISMVVRLSDTLSNMIRIEPREVFIEYNVELSAEKSFDDLTINIYNIPSDKDVLLIPPKLKLNLRGGVEQLSQINPAEIKIGVEYDLIENDTIGYIIPEIELPIEVDIINFEPEKYQYIIKKKY